jgi:hypothetical protein
VPVREFDGISWRDVHHGGNLGKGESGASHDGPTRALLRQLVQISGRVLAQGMNLLRQIMQRCSFVMESLQ